MQDEDAALMACLSALASGPRLAILRKLRTPKALREITVADTEDPRGPPLARQTVRRHLDALIDQGMVVARDAEREYGRTTEFLINHQRIYALAEEVRALARLRPIVDPEAPTRPSAPGIPAPARGPAFVLVKGLDEGTTFGVEPGEGRSVWVLGRLRTCAIPLDFDPAVSGEHAIVHWTGERHEIEDLGSRNGTSVNMQRLSPGVRTPLAHGDIVAAGLTLLVYWR